MAFNSTSNFSSYQSHFLSTSQPFYYSTKLVLFSSLTDHELALISPIIAYWALSLLFHLLDGSTSPWIEKYRIHESAEITNRNKVSKLQVILAVFVQQIIQTFLGCVLVSEDANSSGGSIAKHWGPMQAMVPALQRLLHFMLGSHFGSYVWDHKAEHIVYYAYWWGKPALQLFFAMFIIDTWQYFLHRLMHVNKFLYKHIHSVHHRLYVPYAFGGLYNHPFEGFFLDSIGAIVAEKLSGMTLRQGMLLFTISTFKTVDDHCGYKLPFDPFQIMTPNNADYHDIHHQVIGIKSNFSQPFFVHWDVLLGTRLTRDEVKARKQRKADD